MADPIDHAQAQEAQELFLEIAKLMIPHASVVQGNVISMLLGAFLSGHIALPNDEADADAARLETHKIRATILTLTTGAALRHAAILDEQRSKPPETRQ